MNSGDDDDVDDSAAGVEDNDDDSIWDNDAALGLLSKLAAAMAKTCQNEHMNPMSRCAHDMISMIKPKTKSTNKNSIKISEINPAAAAAATGTPALCEAGS